MATETATQVGLELLTADERAALTGAAAWYYNRHASMIADEADDRSARAVDERERFYDLHDALGKLGVRLALPDGLRPRA